MQEIELWEKQAVEAALRYEWKKAIARNNEILKLDPKNLAAYLRLGFIYLQLYELKKAKSAYLKALKIQPRNQLAKDNLERIKILEAKVPKKAKRLKVSLDPNLFLETAGKTKTVALVNLGQKNILAQLMIGQKVFIKAKKRRMELRTKNNEYIGSFPDDLSKRLSLFIKAGSMYSVFIKEANLNRVVVFIREEKKGKSIMKFSSFPHNIQANLTDIPIQEELKETDEEESLENDLDLEQLAEALASEEKDYLPFKPEEEEEGEEEE